MEVVNRERQSLLKEGRSDCPSALLYCMDYGQYNGRLTFTPGPDPRSYRLLVVFIVEVDTVPVADQDVWQHSASGWVHEAVQASCMRGFFVMCRVSGYSKLYFYAPR